MAGQSDSNMSLFSPEEVPSLLSTHDLQIYAWLFMLGCCFFFFSQIEFMAEDELVEIVPNLRMDSLNFICVISP